MVAKGMMFLITSTRPSDGLLAMHRDGAGVKKVMGRLFSEREGTSRRSPAGKGPQASVLIGDEAWCVVGGVCLKRSSC